MKTVLTREMRPEMERRGCLDCLYYTPGLCICQVGFDNCVVFPPKKPEIPKGPCYKCPYGRREPCVSFCMRKVLNEWRDERKGVSMYL